MITTPVHALRFEKDLDLPLSVELAVHAQTVYAQKLKQHQEDIAAARAELSHIQYALKYLR